MRAGGALSVPVQGKILKGFRYTAHPCSLNGALRPVQETEMYGKTFQTNTEINPGQEKFRNFKENPQTSPVSGLVNESEQG